jgi:hypothetical protein
VIRKGLTLVIVLILIVIFVLGLRDRYGNPGQFHGDINVDGMAVIKGYGDGGYTNYDLEVGIIPDYGMMCLGNFALGMTSFVNGNIDLDGAVMFRNIAGPVSGDIEFIWVESGGGSTRFALPKSGVGNATYNPRSMLIAGPAPTDTNMVKVSYWQGNGIFHNLVCDTSGIGADFGVQNDLEVEGDIFVDSIKESTPDAGIAIDCNMVITGTLTVTGDQSGATDHVFDDYDDIELLRKWRTGEELPFERGDLLNQDRLLRDAIIQLQEQIDLIRKGF